MRTINEESQRRSVFLLWHKLLRQQIGDRIGKNIHALFKSIFILCTFFCVGGWGGGGVYLSERVLGAAPCETLWFFHRIWFILSNKKYKYRGRAQRKTAWNTSLLFLCISVSWLCLFSIQTLCLVKLQNYRNWFSLRASSWSSACWFEPLLFIWKCMEK